MAARDEAPSAGRLHGARRRASRRAWGGVLQWRLPRTVRGGRREGGESHANQHDRPGGLRAQARRGGHLPHGDGVRPGRVRRGRGRPRRALRPEGARPRQAHFLAGGRRGRPRPLRRARARARAQAGARGAPRPLTLVVRAADEVPEAFRSNAGTIGLRMPDNATALALVRAAACPLATTSANLSGRAAAGALDALDPKLAARVGTIVPAGPTTTRAAWPPPCSTARRTPLPSCARAPSSCADIRALA